MSNADFETTIRTWFTNVRGPGLVLPDGWFGRPGDNAHELTLFEMRPNWAILELDHQLLLIITMPATARVDGDDLVIERFPYLVFDWLEYGSRFSPHVDVYRQGILKFIAPPQLKQMAPPPIDWPSA